jgi:amino acid permease
MLAQITFPSIKYVLDGAIFVKCLGVATSYLIVLSHHLPHILPKPSEETMSESTYRAVTLILAVLIFVAPASFPKRIRSLRFTNWAALFCMLYITMLIVYCYFTGYTDPVDGLTAIARPAVPNGPAGGNYTIPTLDDGIDESDILIDTMEVDKKSVEINYWTTDPIAIINAIPIFIFAFGCHQNLFTISNELLDRSVKRLDIVVGYHS